MSKPPEQIPLKFFNAYDMQGRVTVVYKYYDNRVTKPAYWSKAQVSGYMDRARQRVPIGYAGTTPHLYAALDQYPVTNKKVLIIGSRVPTYESIVLAFGGHPYTVDYNTPVCDDPRITILPDLHKLKTMDATLSISSIEHSGLGRYGDTLDPNGDIWAMRDMLTHVADGGLCYLAVPVGKDTLVWNAHRIYGPHRLPLLLGASNETHKWVRVAEYGVPKDWESTPLHAYTQPVFVLRKELIDAA